MSGQEGFGGQPHHGPPRPCASLRPVTRSAFAGCGRTQTQVFVPFLPVLIPSKPPFFERTITNSLVSERWETKAIWISLGGV